MNVIIRLQNLSWSANASDIRQFFKGLQIPEGGVHIVGGEDGDAFIAFSSDEDARQAMSLNGGKIKDVKVMLFLSSRAQMQKVIEKARAASAFMTSKMSAQLPSAEAFTNQFVNKKVPEVASAVVTQPQSLMANYLQHSASVQPLMNFQLKQNEASMIGNQVTAPVAALAGNAQLSMYYAMNNAPDYLNYMKMANATAGYQIDSNKLRDMYNKEKSNPLQHNDYNRYGRSSSRERQRSRSPISSSDEKKERKRRTRFSSPEKSAKASVVPPVINPLLQQNPLMQLQQQFPPKAPVLQFTTNQPAPLISNNNVNTKLSNSIWDVPPPLNLNTYSSFNSANNNNQGSMLNNFQGGNANNYSSSGNANNYTTSAASRNYQTSDNRPNQYQSKDPRYGGNLMSNNSNVNNAAFNNGSSVGTCIKVANIDKDTNYSDVRKFFGGLPIGNNDIKFLKDERGDHTGVALIRFVSSDSKKQSLTKNGWQLKSTQIMITSISEDDFEKGLDSTRSRGGGRDNYNSYRNNYDDQKRDRYNDRFRERSDSRERYDSRERNDSRERDNRDRGGDNNRYQNRNMNNAYNNRYNQPNNSGNNRYNDRNDRYDRDRGNNNYNNNNNGFRNNYNQNNNNNNNNGNNRRDYRRDNDSRNRNFRDNSEPEDKIEYIPDENFTVLVIDDIPDKNEADLFETFPGILGITIDKYTAYCKFKTHEAAKAVLENRFLHYIRNKRVFVEKGAEAQFDDYAKKYGKTDNPEFAEEIASSSKAESENSKDDDVKMEEPAENKEKEPSPSGSEQQDDQKKPKFESRDPRQKSQNDKPVNSPQDSAHNIKTDCVIIKGMDPRTTIEEVEKFFADVDIQKTQMRTHILLDKRGQPCGDCFVEFKFENDVQKATGKNNQELGTNRVQVLAIPREQVEAVLSSFGDDHRPQNSNNNNNNSNNNRGGAPPNRDWAPPNDFGNPGCVVMISNLCYRATIDDLLDEFREFDLKPDQIIRRYNDFGQPSGNACINFNTPADADKACDEYNKIKILNRSIWLRRL